MHKINGNTDNNSGDAEIEALLAQAAEIMNDPDAVLAKYDEAVLV